jgi:cytochrome c553
MGMTRLTAVLAFLLSMAAAHAADAPPGAASCTGCHSASASVQSLVPPIKGRPANEIESQMAEFKTGKRPGTIMDRIAKGFTDEETRAIAAWYAAQK